jgi:hypothetical protein
VPTPSRSLYTKPSIVISSRAGIRFHRGSICNGVPRTLTLVHGVSGYILYRVESGDVIRRFADEVVPAVRNAVSSERGRRRLAAAACAVNTDTC